MATIKSILDKYRPEIDTLDLELLIAHELKQSREFVLTYPDYIIYKNLIRQLAEKISRRKRGEPMAYILGHKEFYGLDFLVTRDTLIPRPETELLVEKVLETIASAKNNPITLIDIGTGSGNIIISIAKNSEPCLPAGRQRSVSNRNFKYFATDISEKALVIAKHNAKKHNLTKIKFIKSNLLDPLFQNLPAGRQGSKFKIKNSKILILANLPYLSKKIYSATAPDVKNFEPKSALYSPRAGLGHYEKLLKQIRTLKNSCYMPACPVGRFHACLSGRQVSCFMEISPEQKKPLRALIKNFLPSAKIKFHKDLAGKWRICFFDLV